MININAKPSLRIVKIYFEYANCLVPVVTSNVVTCFGDFEVSIILKESEKNVFNILSQSITDY